MRLTTLPYLVLLFPVLVFSQDNFSLTNTTTPSSTNPAMTTLTPLEHTLDQSLDTTAPTSTSSPQIFMPSFEILQPNANTVWLYPESVILSWDTSKFKQGIILGGIMLVLANNSEHGGSAIITALKPLGFDLSAGNVTIPVPDVETGNYVVAITAELYHPIQSAVFLLKNPNWTAPIVTYPSANVTNTTTSSSPSPTAAASGGSSSSSIGVIAGSVVGGIAGAAMVVAIMYVFRWKISSFMRLDDMTTRKNEDMQLQEQKPKNWKYGNLDDGNGGVIPEGSHA